jgi:hypothetical protein
MLLERGGGAGQEGLAVVDQGAGEGPLVAAAGRARVVLEGGRRVRVRVVGSGGPRCQCRGRRAHNVVGDVNVVEAVLAKRSRALSGCLCARACVAARRVV